MSESYTPTPERVTELLDLWRNETLDHHNYYLRRPDDWESWDDLIECRHKMTFEEWQWCGEHFAVTAYVDVHVQGDLPPGPAASGQLSSGLQVYYDAAEKWLCLEDPAGADGAVVGLSLEEAKEAIRWLLHFVRLAEDP